MCHYYYHHRHYYYYYYYYYYYCYYAQSHRSALCGFGWGIQAYPCTPLPPELRELMRASQPSANGAMLNAPPQSHKCPVQNSERTEISRLRRTFSRTGLLNYVVEQVCYKSTNGLKWHSDDRGVVGVEDETDEITTIVFGASLFHIVMLVVIMLAVCV